LSDKGTVFLLVLADCLIHKQIQDKTTKWDTGYKQTGEEMNTCGQRGGLLS